MNTVRKSISDTVLYCIVYRLLFLFIQIILTFCFSLDKHGVVLNMSSREKLLLKLSTKENLILCSAVSGCGKWVAYGDQRVVRLYRFALVS